MHTLAEAVTRSSEQAGWGTTVSGALSVEGSSPPMSSRNGGYVSVISPAYAMTRKTQRFIPSTKS